MEQFLLERARREPLIELHLRSRVEEVRQTPEAVELIVASAAGSTRHSASYLVAADGARSTVRETLGQVLRGKSHSGRYLIADIEMPSDYPTERRAWFDPPANPGATILMHRQPDNIWRIDYQLRED